MPEFSNGVILQYIVHLLVPLASDATMFNVSSLNFSLMLMDLIPHTSYTVEIFAVTVESGMSGTFSFTTAQDSESVVATSFHALEQFSINV